MDQTLSQILTALYQAHATIDQLQQQVARLEAQLAQRTNGVVTEPEAAWSPSN